MALCCIAVVSRLLTANFVDLKNKSKERREKFRSDMSEMKNLLQLKQPLLVDGGHIVNYYFPGKSEWINSLHRINVHAAEFAIRKNYQYVIQDSLLEQGYYKGLLISKHRNYRPNQFEKLVQQGYKLKELNNYYLFTR
jgi:hypothetical protein